MPFMARILLDIFIIFLAAKLADEIFRRLGQPSVIGELLAGVLIGPFVLGLIGHPDAALVAAFHGEEPALEALRIVYEVLAEIGVIVLMFFVGLETRLTDIVSVGRRAILVGAIGVVLPFLFGYVFVAGLGYPSVPAVFIATALVATSVGITARVLADLGALQRPEARIILGAAVVDDILGMLLLAVVAGGSTNGGVSWGQIALIAAEALIFTGFVVLVGSGAVRRFDAHLDALRVRNSAFVAAIIVCLGLAGLAGYIGLAAIIGAFLAGMIFAEARQHHDLVNQTLPVYDLLVPFFFVVTGAQLDPRLFLDGRLAGLALAITALAIAGKLLGCSVGALGLPLRSVAIIGVGMVPRGEVGLIVASVGRSLHVIPDELFSVVVVMSVLTTVLVPPILNLLYRLPSQPIVEKLDDQEPVDDEDE